MAQKQLDQDVHGKICASNTYAATCWGWVYTIIDFFKKFGKDYRDDN